MREFIKDEKLLHMYLRNCKVEFVIQAYGNSQSIGSG